MEHENLKQCIDISCLGVTLGAIASWLPPLSALASLVWALIRIYETDTIQKLLHRKD
jgi:hypothetical protein